MVNKGTISLCVIILLFFWYKDKYRDKILTQYIADQGVYISMLSKTLSELMPLAWQPVNPVILEL